MARSSIVLCPKQRIHHHHRDLLLINTAAREQYVVQLKSKSGAFELYYKEMSPQEEVSNDATPADGNSHNKEKATTVVQRNQQESHHSSDIEEASSSVEQDKNSVHEYEKGLSTKDKRERTTLCFTCLSWSRERIQSTALGCLSSCVVLTVRLLLDKDPLAYLIHSIIVFLDMILIHLFTHSVWLSVSGEIVTVIFFLAFHFTKETVFELLETTLIAVLCSFHLIGARSKSKDRQEELEVGMENLRRQSMMILRRSVVGGGGVGVNEGELEEFLLQAEDNNGNNNNNSSSLQSWFVPPTDPVCQERARVCGERFFEHFLDGSAGVMYTSFLGLIISELVTYGSKQK